MDGWMDEKAQGFAPENSLFKPEFTFPTSYAFQLLDDDVVDMVMWLA